MIENHNDEHGWRPTRRELLIATGVGGTGLAVEWVMTRSRVNQSPRRSSARSTGSNTVRPAFIEPRELASVHGALAVTLRVASSMVAFGSSTRWSLTYNGTSPGPTLLVRPGDRVELRLENQLDMPTNLHAHGLRVSPTGHGDNPFAMTDPGATYTYGYQIPTDHPAGTFWYHPHHHGLVARQLFGGLAGTIIVQPADAPGAEIQTRLFVLTDPHITAKPDGSAVSMMTQMNGRQGDAILVNGLLAPRLSVNPGTFELWRIVNASASRTHRLRLEGHRFSVVASDGGRLPNSRAATELVLAPAQRTEVLVAVKQVGEYQLTASITDDVGSMGMGTMGGATGTNAMNETGGKPTGLQNPSVAGQLVVASVHVYGRVRNDAVRRVSTGRVADLRGAAIARTRELTLSVTMNDAMTAHRFLINGRSFDPNRTDITTHLGDVEDWTLRNTSTMDHPFHLHTWPFQVVASATDPSPPREWKDVVNVPAGGWIRIRIPFDAHPGRSVFHCHIADHEDGGMMATIEVLDTVA